MDARELMIGDWYYASEEHRDWYGDYTLEFYPKKLTIDDLVFAKENDWDELDWSDFTKPIPLTAEILEKNGFDLDVAEYQCGGFYQFPKEYKDIVIRGFGVEHHEDMFFITDHALMPVIYVHKFQQALRLAGLKELANNFNI